MRMINSSTGDAARRRAASSETSQGYIPTVGEYAQRVLLCIEHLHGSKPVMNDQYRTNTHDKALDFVHCCLALGRKFPRQTQLAFELLLPFTPLEMELVHRVDISDPRVAELITNRLVDWISCSPIFVGETNVHVSDFLIRLAPHLDLWAERHRALDIARCTSNTWPGAI